MSSKNHKRRRIKEEAQYPEPRVHSKGSEREQEEKETQKNRPDAAMHEPPSSVVMFDRVRVVLDGGGSPETDFSIPNSKWNDLGLPRPSAIPEIWEIHTKKMSGLSYKTNSLTWDVVRQLLTEESKFPAVGPVLPLSLMVVMGCLLPEWDDPKNKSPGAIWWRSARIIDIESRSEHKYEDVAAEIEEVLRCVPQSGSPNSSLLLKRVLGILGNWLRDQTSLKTDREIRELWRDIIQLRPSLLFLATKLAPQYSATSLEELGELVRQFTSLLTLLKDPVLCFFDAVWAAAEFHGVSMSSCMPIQITGSWLESIHVEFNIRTRNAFEACEDFALTGSLLLECVFGSKRYAADLALHGVGDFTPLKKRPNALIQTKPLDKEKTPTSILYLIGTWNVILSMGVTPGVDDMCLPLMEFVYEKTPVFGRQLFLSWSCAQAWVTKSMFGARPGSLTTESKITLRHLGFEVKDIPSGARTERELDRLVPVGCTIREARMIMGQMSSSGLEMRLLDDGEDRSASGAGWNAIAGLSGSVMSFMDDGEERPATDAAAGLPTREEDKEVIEEEEDEEWKQELEFKSNYHRGDPWSSMKPDKSDASKGSSHTKTKKKTVRIPPFDSNTRPYWSVLALFRDLPLEIPGLFPNIAFSVGDFDGIFTRDTVLLQHRLHENQHVRLRRYPELEFKRGWGVVESTILSEQTLHELVLALRNVSKPAATGWVPNSAAGPSSHLALSDIQSLIGTLLRPLHSGYFESSTWIPFAVKYTSAHIRFRDCKWRIRVHHDFNRALMSVTAEYNDDSQQAAQFTWLHTSSTSSLTKNDFSLSELQVVMEMLLSVSVIQFKNIALQGRTPPNLPLDRVIFAIGSFNVSQDNNSWAIADENDSTTDADLMEWKTDLKAWIMLESHLTWHSFSKFLVLWPCPSSSSSSFSFDSPVLQELDKKQGLSLRNVPFFMDELSRLRLDTKLVKWIQEQKSEIVLTAQKNQVELQWNKKGVCAFHEGKLDRAIAEFLCGPDGSWSIGCSRLNEKCLFETLWWIEQETKTLQKRMNPPPVVVVAKANESKDKEETLLCKICYDKPIQTVVIGCGHGFACKNCSAKLRKCAICNAYPVQFQNLFLAQ